MTDDDDVKRTVDSGSYDDFLREAARIDPVSVPDVNLLGVTLAHYRVVARLGRGGMGVVYRATDEKLRREIALKVLPDSFAADEERRRRFIREARSAAAITHANIATVHDVGEADGHVFIAMELVDGETLRARIDKGVGVAESLRIAVDIARGLSRAHEKGIVHRDLKPENVMITRHEEVKILDFGLAKLREDVDATPSVLAFAETEMNLTQDGRILGTPAYMSPEQARGNPVDARTDVFAFGVVLYEMLTGVRPFVGGTTQELLMAIARDAPKGVAEANALVPPDVAHVVTRCLEKLPDARYANGQELLSALSLLAAPRTTSDGGEPRALGQPTPSLLTPGGATVTADRARPRAWSFALLAGVLAIAGGSYAWRARYVGAPVGPPPASVLAAPSAAPSAQARAVTRIIDLPAPKTDIREASAEYMTAMQAFRDDNFNKALTSYQKAGELDPKMAMAHLHLALMLSVYNVPTVRRAVYEQALGVRGGLDERDRGLVEALQPLLQPAAQDPAEADRRLAALASRFPGDVEILMLRAIAHYGTGAALAPARMALDLDPEDAQSFELVGDAYYAEGKYAEAEESLRQCSKFSPDSADCFGWLSLVEMADGKCEDAEQDAIRARDRNGIWGFALLFAMPSMGRSATLLDETARRLVSAMPPLTAPEAYGQGMKVREAILVGDFDRAAVETKRESAMLAANPAIATSYLRRLLVLDHEVEIALETGEDAAVKKLVDDFVAHRAAWDTEVVLAHGTDLSLSFERLALPSARPPPEAFDARRKAWIAQQLFAGADRGEVWNYAYAATALTPAEAQAALDVRPEYGPPTPTPIFNADMSGRAGSPEAELGRMALLLGRTDEAIEHLRRAVATCDVYTSTFDHVRAWLNLGVALEAKHDTKGACDAYDKVLAQWGRAKPRSVTADKARARAKALACGN